MTTVDERETKIVRDKSDRIKVLEKVAARVPSPQTPHPMCPNKSAHREQKPSSICNSTATLNSSGTGIELRDLFPARKMRFHIIV